MVEEGISAADESLLTGESRPVLKQPGDSVTAGALNCESPLFVRVTEVGEKTRLSAIIHLMERAATEKPHLVQVADRVAHYFVLALLGIALLVALGWLWVAPEKALWITVSVLVVTCPCALSLATPIALTVAAGALARSGLLMTRSHAIETLARATHFVFDKTGTLTTGMMTLREVLPLADLSRDQCLALAASLEQASEHPLARALCAAAEGSLRPVVTQVQSTPGQGVEGMLQGRRVRIGRPGFVLALSESTMPPEGGAWLAMGDTVVFLGDETGCLGLFCLVDTLRPEARELVSDLQAAGKTVVLLTGDATAVAERVSKELGIRALEAELTPEGKHDYVAGLQNSGATVVMVGDGINDAPVLARAAVSIAMGHGAQLARAQSDFVLLSDNLAHLRVGLAKAGLTLKIVRQNLWWSFAYNIVAIPLAVAGWVTPWLAGIGMSASSLGVVLNSLRIQRGR